MLVELYISDLAIIESLRLRFGPGFNVLTGETGAGKSIIVDAVGLLVGARASIDLVRSGAQRAVVEGVFSLSPQVLALLRPLLQELGLLSASSDLILRREIARRGRSICRVNGIAVTLATLRDVGQHVIDIHGQGECLSLRQVKGHLGFLDRYGGQLELRGAFAALVGRLRRVRRELTELRKSAREMARRMDLLTYQVAEIRAADLHPEEEAALMRERTLLSNAEELTRLSGEACDLLSEGERGQQSIIDLLGVVVDRLSSLAQLDDSLCEQRRLAEGAFYELEELARAVRSYRDEIEYDPERLRAVEERIGVIYGLKRKYGGSIEEVLAFAERGRRELENASRGGERAAELASEERELLAQIGSIGRALNEGRRRAAETLTAIVESELDSLNMAHARFLVGMHWREDPDGVEVEGKQYAFDSTGLDQVEFLIAPNVGEEPKPLARIASGGETSRLMLAMRAALSAVDPVPTLIFDEIDSGIGGRTGGVVGRKLWSLSREHQVFCVTHLAQMACYADRHFRVMKRVVGNRAVSSAQQLSADQRIEELAMMLGTTVTEATRRSAGELLERAKRADVVQSELC